MSKISVVGSINMDLVVVSERMPDKGETIKGNSFDLIPGGKGANQAVAMARLGGDVTMFGCVGKDIYGTALLENLAVNGVNTDNIKSIEGESSGVALINVAEGDNNIIIVAGANGMVDIEYVNSVKARILQSSIVLLQHEIPVDTIEYVIKLCRENDIPVVLNPAPAAHVKQEMIDMISYITPNEHEAKIVFDTDEALEELVKKYPNKLIITLGEKGAMYSSADELKIIPAIKANVVDTTGAGDTFCGALTKGIADGLSLDEAINIGQYAGGMSVEKFGAQGGMPTHDELIERMERDKR